MQHPPAAQDARNDAPVSIGSIGSLLSAMWSAAGATIMIHALWGLLVLLMAIGTTPIALRYHKRSVTATSVLALVSMVLAVLGGLVWAASDFSNGGGIALIVNGALGAYAFFFLALYYTK